MHSHDGCCCCNHHGMARRTFLATVGGSALGTAALTGCATAGKAKEPGGARLKPTASTKELVVKPALSYRFHKRAKATSWRPWGGLATEQDVEQELARIDGELGQMAKKAGFPIKVLPVARVTSRAEGENVCKSPADVMLIYAAAGDGGDIEAMISPERHNLMFVRHRSGPVYLWYEIASPRMLRKTVDEFGQPGLTPRDVVVDSHDEVLWRLRALYGLKNTVGSKIVAIGDASGWGAGGRQAPQIAREKWKLDIVDEPYEDLGKRIASARGDKALVRNAEAAAEDYLKDAGVTLKTDKGFVTRAFLLRAVFEALMQEHGAYALTVNNCMSTIMPMSETTACLPLSLINDSGALAFCESDFVVIPSGILLHHISGTPVFLNDPTYPHDGVITIAHCTAPRRMDGKRLEKARILTHFESDYGAAPKVEMKKGTKVTNIIPDFAASRYVGFLGEIVETPFLPICRCQVEVAYKIPGQLIAQNMPGFHWETIYGDYLNETGYALKKIPIAWQCLG